MRNRDFFPFGYKLMLSYLLFVTVPILVIGLFAYFTFLHTIKEQTRVNIQGALDQIKENVVYKLEDAVRISDLLYSDYSLARNLRNFEVGLRQLRDDSEVFDSQISEHRPIGESKYMVICISKKQGDTGNILFPL